VFNDTNNKIKTMLSEKIIKFLKDRPLISVKGLEQTLSIPDSTIRRAMVGLRNIPKKHYESICNELKKYGFSDEIK